MAQNITLIGASYPDVPAVTLPKTGGGTASFTDVTDTTATASDVASGKYFYTAGGVKTQGTSIGGATNFVEGTFKTIGSRNGTGQITVPYSGSGYPIAMSVFVKGGMYNNTEDGDTDWYNSKTRYDVGAYYMSKAVATAAPDYSSTSNKEDGVVSVTYKNSTTSSTVYVRAGGQTIKTFGNTVAGASTNCIRIMNNTTFSYYTGNKTSDTIGLCPSTEYTYFIVYSS